MRLDDVSSGKDVPYSIHVIIEIPAHGLPVKYEVDKATGAMFVDRFLNTPMFYPCNYGYVPGTLSEDGDPVDVLVVTPWALITGSVIACRPIGMLKMTDEKGVDMKILAVPVDKLTNLYQEVKTHQDMPASLLLQIEHFFSHYKDLEPNKWVKLDGWVGVEEAHAEILTSIERFA